MLTYDVVNFEQLGPDVKFYTSHNNDNTREVTSMSPFCLLQARQKPFLLNYNTPDNVTRHTVISPIYFLQMDQTLFISQDIYTHNLMCQSIGAPKIINFPFVPNGKFIVFRCPEI